MTSQRAFLLGAGLSILLSACSGVPDRNPGSPYYAYPAGMSASLAKPLAIPAGEAGVRLQYGRPVARNGVQETDPHCILEFDEVAGESLTVAPERFRITAVRRREVTFSGMPVLIRQPMGVGLGRDGGPSNIYFVTEFILRSDAGTRVRNLACQHNVAGAAIPRHLSLAEMRQALGDYLILDLPH